MDSKQVEIAKKQNEFFMTNITQAHLIGATMIKDSKASVDLIDEYKRKIDNVKLCC